MNSCETSPLTLWYRQPAANWNEALPLGNGRLGAMIFGGMAQERLQLNEETVWAGQAIDRTNPAALEALPTVRELLFAGRHKEATELADRAMLGIPRNVDSYQPLADLELSLLKVSGIDECSYRRSLDLRTGIHRVTFQWKNWPGQIVTHVRETFVSAPDQVMVTHLCADQHEPLYYRLRFDREQDIRDFSAQHGHLILRGCLGEAGLAYQVEAVVTLEEGFITHHGNSLIVNAKGPITICVTGATSYVDRRIIPPIRHNAAVPSSTVSPGNPMRSCVPRMSRIIQRFLGVSPLTWDRANRKSCPRTNA